MTREDVINACRHSDLNWLNSNLDLIETKDFYIDWNSYPNFVNRYNSPFGLVRIEVTNDTIMNWHIRELIPLLNKDVLMKLYENWSTNSSITESEFFEAMLWLCEDPGQDIGDWRYPTREVGLAQTGLNKLKRVNGEVSALYDETGYLWCGERFKRKPENEGEKWWVSRDGMIHETHKICVNLRDLNRMCKYRETDWPEEKYAESSE